MNLRKQILEICIVGSDHGDAFQLNVEGLCHHLDQDGVVDFNFFSLQGVDLSIALRVRSNLEGLARSSS
jgi:hypothetical protein